MDEKIEALAQLFRETAMAHHEAYSATDGDDPAWPLWYADYLSGKLPAHLGKAIDKDTLVDELTRLDQEVKARHDGQDWAVYYAQSLLDQTP
ncbi:MAG: hypothetical protein GC179_17485 [Anaerolineaceae bacterium]|nr:hypothetical protein [Anaerolineaceae bacterium]